MPRKELLVDVSKATSWCVENQVLKKYRFRRLFSFVPGFFEEITYHILSSVPISFHCVSIQNVSIQYGSQPMHMQSKRMDVQWYRSLHIIALHYVALRCGNGNGYEMPHVIQYHCIAGIRRSANTHHYSSLHDIWGRTAINMKYYIHVVAYHCIAHVWTGTALVALPGSRMSSVLQNATFSLKMRDWSPKL